MSPELLVEEDVVVEVVFAVTGPTLRVEISD